MLSRPPEHGLEERRFEEALPYAETIAELTETEFGSPSTELATSLANGVTMAQEIGLQMVVKFDTASAESYEYVAPCSGRGLCNEGNCECFAGYTGDNCNLQSALAS